MTATEKWVLDPNHSELGFKIKHLMITNVKGSFKKFEANIQTKGDDFMTADVECLVYTDSVDTGSPDRDKHIKGPEFFDSEKFPVMKFKAKAYENVDNDGSYELWGDLEIKGITNNIRLDVEFGGIVKDPWGNEKAGFTINGWVNRKDWGLNWNSALETGGFLLSDDVLISCEVQLMRAL
jgi:polyisoprenoid-binding protein YceI